MPRIKTEMQNVKMGKLQISSKNTVRVVSVDPGYDRFGIAVLERKVGEKERLIFSDCLQTKTKDSFVVRLEQVINFFQLTIQKHQPDFFAIETLFFSTNQKTAMRVAEVRGAVLFVARDAGLKIMEINPMQIKLAVTGDGKSDKNQMIKMIKLLTGLNKKTHDDEYDAVATGIAFLSLYREGITLLD